ncbi:hypothetical protein EI94DRAFT_1702619 [Lactarius quietus]|nr:hypothetical protein EI94DRAFT_1702619 [Lactarius quietus]
MEGGNETQLDDISGELQDSFYTGLLHFLWYKVKQNETKIAEWMEFEPPQLSTAGDAYCDAQPLLKAFTSVADVNLQATDGHGFTTTRDELKLLQMPSIADQSHDHEEGEFEAYYVGMFSDCDLFMQYCGGGIGHIATQHCDSTLLADTHKKVQQSDAADDSEEEDNEEGSEEDEGDEEGDESDDRELEDEGDAELRSDLGWTDLGQQPSGLQQYCWVTASEQAQVHQACCHKCAATLHP